MNNSNSFHDDHDDHDEPHDRGLQFDLATLLERRNVLKLFAGGALIGLVGCSDNDTPSGEPSSFTTATPDTALAQGSSTATQVVSPIPATETPASSCTTSLPQETAGPYPGDGSNGPNVLTQSGVVRNDIRASFGQSTTVAEGVPLTIALTVVDTANACKPLAGAAVYLWHCDREGRYSMYSEGVTDETYLRGVGETDANGTVSFVSVFPGCYSGRWPHVHFEIYPGLAAAMSSANKLSTSQLALPEEVCDAVYAADGYGSSVRNLAQVSLANDNVFRDGYDLQMAQVSGSVIQGYTASLLLGV